MAVPALHPPDQFLHSAAQLGIEFEGDDIDKLSRYLALLLDANTRFNLTAITDPTDAWHRHILDSLTLVPFIISLTEGAANDGDRSNDNKDVPAPGPNVGSTGVSPVRIIDIGSGGGLPGIPLAIVMPQMQFTLLEATGKKAAFLREVVADLQLNNVNIINDRAETVGQDHQQHRERYDLVMARAVGRLPVLLELTVPLVKIGGCVLAMKGEKAAEEIADAKPALHLLHAHVVDTVATGTGTLVIIEKQRKTPRLYPRSPGEPKRSPLH